MSNQHTKRQVSVRLNAIRRTQKQLEERIRAVQEQLKRAENLPATQPFIELVRRVRSVQDLRSPFRTLKEALQHQLLQLKALRRELGLEANDLQNVMARRPRLFAPGLLFYVMVGGYQRPAAAAPRSDDAGRAA